MADQKTPYRCIGTFKLKGETVRCNKIIAEIEHVNDAKILLKCPKCGTMNTIEAKPTAKEDNTSTVLLNGHSTINLGSFNFQHISE